MGGYDMILKQTINIHKYDWKVIVYYNTVCLDCIYNSLEEIGCTKIDEILNFIEKGELNTGCIYSNYREHKSVIVIGKANSFSEYLNTVEHEKNHLEMHICKAYGIDPFSEEAANLAGYLSQLFLNKALSTIIALD